MTRIDYPTSRGILNAFSLHLELFMAICQWPESVTSEPIWSQKKSLIYYLSQVTGTVFQTTKGF